MLKSMLKIKTIKLLLIFSLFANISFADDKQFLFNTIEFKSSTLKSLPKWIEVLEKMKIEKTNVNKCYKDTKLCNSDFIPQWVNFIKDAKKIKDKQALLNSVNSFFNDWEYILDIDNWGINDYWEIPSEFLEFAGDCEDYAIIKYYTLRTLGFKAEDLRIVILKDTVRNGAHAVLAVYINNKVQILDNLSTIPLSDKVLTQYVPYYSINEHNKWIHFKKL